MTNERTIAPSLTLLALAISAFAIGSTEFISVGVMPMIVDAFHISLATAGLTVSVYAAGVMVGAPLLTTITGRIPRKRLILLIMTVFIVGNLLTAAAPNFTVLLIGRVVSALAHGIFMTVATVIAANVVPMNKRASAIAAMFTGLTVATVTGVPLGTFIGQHASWHMSFVTIAFVGLIGLVADFILVPAGLPMPAQGKRGSLLRIAKQPTILLSLILTAIGYGASSPVYTYLTTILTKQGWAASASVIILIIYGIAVAVGNTVGGRLANENPLRALFMMFAALAVVLIAMLFGLSLQVIGLALILLLGLLAFMNVPGLQLFTMQATEKFLPADVQMASALNISAFNVGVMAGSFAGGQLVEQVGLMSTPIAGIGMAVLAMLIIGALARREY
ncbi:MFS transporter [Secundilactobacillus paracollinoides]|uniref:MFS sugar transporter n=1 Tax=Secundilactobacillus paracollinoides TaxID=240427 RepID=A0A1B2IVY0_9LACO|nr:MFS transporter [Secundilactobacillus paracollinoides]ANZ60372.1 MFS sugar transporter [Secundilactobacillus paracollinoides]ANZ66200.1 MFS sugar transporter [Secundilactobacillus paracollinoides]